MIDVEAARSNYLLAEEIAELTVVAFDAGTATVDELEHTELVAHEAWCRYVAVLREAESALRRVG